METGKIDSLKQSYHALFDTPQGEEVMEHLESICNWYPTVYDSKETNEVIMRDAKRQVLATIKTILTCSPNQLHILMSDV